MIRRATRTEDGGADVQRALRHLRALANAPNETEGNVSLIFEQDVVMVDTTEDVLVRVHKRFKHDEANIPWWFWEGDFEPRVVPALRRALLAFVQEYPGSEPWVLWGDLPSEAQLKELQAMFGGPRYVAEVLSPIKGMWRGASTLGTMLARSEGLG